MTDKSILLMPYKERQMVVVSDKRVVDALKKEKETATQAKFSWPDFAARVGKILVRSQFGLAYDAVEYAVKAWIKARESGVAVLPISNEQAKELSFPIGHPLEGVVYIGHPAVNKVYFTLADFIGVSSITSLAKQFYF